MNLKHKNERKENEKIAQAIACATRRGAYLFMRRKGFSYSEIAKHLQISVSTVWYTVNDRRTASTRAKEKALAVIERHYSIKGALKYKPLI